MPAKQGKAGREVDSADSSAAVDRFMAGLEHPCKDAIQVLREILCGVHGTIAEGVKWNAPSFRTTECFATTHLREKAGVVVILHLGARMRDNPALKIEDPSGLLKWLGKDRAIVRFDGMSELRASREVFERIVRQWIKYV